MSVWGGSVLGWGLESSQGSILSRTWSWSPPGGLVPSCGSILWGHQCWSSPKGSVPFCRSVLGARALLVLPCPKPSVPQTPVPSAVPVPEETAQHLQWHACRSHQQGSSLGNWRHPGLVAAIKAWECIKTSHLSPSSWFQVWNTLSWCSAY